jgi:hypothetical protein
MRTKDEILDGLKKVPDTAVDRILIEVLCDIRDVLNDLFRTYFYYTTGR